MPDLTIVTAAPIGAAGNVGIYDVQDQRVG